MNITDGFVVKTPKFWTGAGYILSSAILLLIILWLDQRSSLSSLEFWFSAGLALVPMVIGIHEIMHYLRYKWSHDKSLPGWYFWNYGVIPVLIALGMLLTVNFIPPLYFPGNTPIVIAFALILGFFGIVGMLRYLNSREQG